MRGMRVWVGDSRTGVSWGQAKKRTKRRRAASRLTPKPPSSSNLFRYLDQASNPFTKTYCTDQSTLTRVAKNSFSTKKQFECLKQKKHEKNKMSFINANFSSFSTPSHFTTGDFPSMGVHENGMEVDGSRFSIDGDS